jgi:DNA repair and recombination RAD54-like protein
MLIRRKTLPGQSSSSSSLGAATLTKTVCAVKKASTITSHSKLFRPGGACKIIVQRAPLLCGLSLPAGLSKKFQRPMTKRRSYDRSAENALKTSSLGPKKRMDGMSKLLARAGRGLTFQLPSIKTSHDMEGNTDDESGSDDEKAKEAERPFEPLQLWTSPHQGGEAKGLEPRTYVIYIYICRHGQTCTLYIVVAVILTNILYTPLLFFLLTQKSVTEMRPDEFGIEEQVTVIRPAPVEAYSREHVFVPPVLAKWLRPHQREGVQFLYDCVQGLKDFKGAGALLADDMGLGKTLQSVALIYTLLKTGITANKLPTCQRIIVVCPCSLVKNWENEFVKWLGVGAVKALAIAEADRKTVEKNLDIFVKTKMFNVLICSYECLRAHVGRLTKFKDCCDLLVCDEAHRLKNSENQTSRALNSLPVKRRVLLTGTPMQNDLQEFYAMVDFTNPGILGTPEGFRRNTLFPILRGREPHASEAQKRKMMQIQNDMSTTVNDFILRRVNTLNAEHLPPKLVQVVCCNLTDIQQNMYQHLVSSKDMQHVLDGKQVNCLASIQMLMKLCNHPSLVVEDEKQGHSKSSKRAAASKQIKYSDEDKEPTAAPGSAEIAKFLPYVAGGGGGRGNFALVHPEWSGKMFVLYRLMKEMRRPGNGNDKIVIVSNYTQTLDLIGRMCRENSWGFCRLDGSVTMKKRQKMVDEFNDPSTPLVAFLLSSKAGGWYVCCKPSWL